MAHPTQDMGFTGSVSAVRGDVLSTWLDAGITPVLAPVCLGEDADTTYNVNGDHVAGAVASAIGATRVVFLTNVQGVLVDGVLAPTLTPVHTHELIENGTIFGGMIPKVQTALHTLESGVPNVVITDLSGLKSGGGTTFTNLS
jgi:acetylglutamate kinase